MYKPKYFTLDELTRSATADRHGIRNVPGPIERNNLLELIEHVLDPLRLMWGKPIRVNSGYRCRQLNSHPDIGGSASSSHITGQAADITVGGRDENMRLYQMIKGSDIPFHKAIFEQNRRGSFWIHISFRQKDPARLCYIYEMTTKTYRKDRT